MKIFPYCCSLLILCYCVTAYSVDIYGHRGARGLAPENTLPAYQTALQQNVNFVDMDVLMTKDHVLVAQHDIALNPNITRDEKGRWIKNTVLIKNLTFKQLQAYDVGRLKPDTRYAKLFPQQQGLDGVHIPSAKNVISYVKNTVGNKVGFQIEIKTDPAHPDWTYSPEELAQAVVNLIHEENITNRVEVQAYDWRCLYALQKLDPQIKTAYLTDVEQEKVLRNPDPQIAGSWTGGKLLKNYNSIPQMIAALGGKLWDPQDTELTPEDLLLAHKLGLKVVVWSWPEQSGAEINVLLLKKLIKMGVNGIITDRPDIVRQLLS